MYRCDIPQPDCHADPGFGETDVRVAAFAEELLDGLPASPYPFSVNIELAKQGQALLPNIAPIVINRNGKVYDNLGTSMKRAYVVGTLLNHAARKELYDNCSRKRRSSYTDKISNPALNLKAFR